MPIIPILLSDSQALVEYKISLDRRTVEESEALELLADYRNYYAGDHALLLSNDQQKFLTGVITSSDHYPVDNKCRVVVDRLRALIDVQGVEGGGQSVDFQERDRVGTSPADLIATWWRASSMNRWERELYKFALRDGEAYVMCWHDGTRPRMTVYQAWDGDTGMRMFYEDPGTRTTPMYASRHWWQSDPVTLASVKRITVYTATGVYKYARLGTREQEKRLEATGVKVLGTDADGMSMVQDPGDPGWPLPWVDGQGNPLGLAVTPFVTPGGSVLHDLIGLNNALNKTNIDILALSDQQAFGQIVVQYDVLPEVTDDPTQDGDGLGLRPGRVLETTGQVTKLPADDLAGLLEAARHWVTTISGNSYLPLHVFLPLSGQVYSGTALALLEGGQTARAEEIAASYTAGYERVFALLQRLDATFGSGPAEATALTPMWKNMARSDPDSELKSLQVEQLRMAIEQQRAGGEGLA